MTDHHAGYILPLATDEASLDNAGGKGLNLTRLQRAGFAVPEAFIISTAAYVDFVASNSLKPLIAESLHELRIDEPADLEAASQAIREGFSSGYLEAGIEAEIRAAYHKLGSRQVAVRSSATAEDLPGQSFAGQQDTYLNVLGKEALLQAVINCWSSLWTARAIGYRQRNRISHQDASLAVVVQKMVPSEASGVMFTANPLTGKRDEFVIDAVFGLGEALVAGQVEPDHIVVDASGHVLSKTLGRKGIAIRANEQGGTQTIEQEAAASQVLTHQQILQLVQVGHAAAELFGAPQDIEWALVGEELSLLQSRSITTLFPLPAGVPARPLKVFLSFGAVQGLLEPMTPLGRDTIRSAFTGLASLFGYHYSLEELPTLSEAGERLWINMTGLLRTRLGRRLLLGALDYVEPGAKQGLQALEKDDDQLKAGGLPPLTLLRRLSILPSFLAAAVRTLLNPEAERDRMLQAVESMLVDFKEQLAACRTASERLRLFRFSTGQLFEWVIRQFVPRFGMGMASYNVITHLAQGMEERGAEPRLMMRSLSHNVTTEMDLSLWRASQEIGAHETARDHFLQASPDSLAQDYRTGRLPPAAETAVSSFMASYGMRGLGEIDLGRPRWGEDPTPIMQAIRSYLLIEDPEMAPDLLFAHGRRKAETEIEEFIQGLAHSPAGWVKSRLGRWATRRMRLLAGLRETPKFTIVRYLGQVREALLELGRAWKSEGLLNRADDVFFLTQMELEAMAAGEARAWDRLIEGRRQANCLERSRKQIPRLLLSDGRAIYEGIYLEDEAQPHIMSGSPVSPGLVEGPVRVVLDPGQANLEPGEILVCPGTDPSWTPLFLAAGGLIMEVGGMMTHGAVVAREYGIPAVVGVTQATNRLKTGQVVQVDGSSGQIMIV